MMNHRLLVTMDIEHRAIATRLGQPQGMAAGVRRALEQDALIRRTLKNKALPAETQVDTLRELMGVGL